MSAPVTACFILVLIAQTVYAWRTVSTRTRIQFVDNQWTLTSLDTGTKRRATLRHARYRSSWLIVLVFDTERGEQIHQTIWRDSVTAETFSRLHFAAAYGCQPQRDDSPGDTLRYTGDESRLHRVIAALKRKV